MKTAQIVLTSLADTPDTAALTAIAPQLVLIFADPLWFADATLIERLRQQMQPASLIGCSSAGEVAGAAVHAGTCVITAIHFDSPDFLVASTPLAEMDDSFAAGQRLGATLTACAPHSVWVLGPGVAINGSALVEGLRATLPAGTMVSGGLAGDAGAFLRTWTSAPSGTGNNEVIAIAFHGDALHLDHSSFGGWSPFGPARQVTRGAGNMLFELDGERALDVYKRYLGSYADDLPATGLLFPFAMLDSAQDEVGLIRTILAVDETDGSLTLAGEIDPTGYLRLMHASTNSLVDGAETAACELPPLPAGTPALALLVSCVGRKLVMGERVDEEVEAVAETLGPATRLAGFYSNGEIGPVGSDARNCKLHNQTMTITRLSEHL